MIKEITKYPNRLSKEFDSPVRFFDDNTKKLIQDLKDTIILNDLKSLSAYEINNPLNIIVIKHEDSFLEMINPNIYHSDGKIISDEKSYYFGEVSAKINRYKNIKVLYEDINKKTHYLNANDELAILIQRAVDFTLGGTIRYRLNEEDQGKFDLKLEYGSKYIDNDSCPTLSIKDKILNFSQYIIAMSFILLIFAFFLNEENSLILQKIEYFLMSSILLLSMIYFSYGVYEYKKNKYCSRCEIGQVVTNTVASFIKLSILLLLNYFIF